jgi:hypothetical protein
MTEVKYNNRYGDSYTFTKTEDGNIFWEGEFGWTRIGYPNVYDEAYGRYIEDGGNLTLGEFKEEVHRADYDSKGTYLQMSEVSQKYSKLVHPDTEKINMVDPPGGPYICEGFGMEVFDKLFKGMIVEELQPIETGYKIIIKK